MAVAGCNRCVWQLGALGWSGTRFVTAFAPGNALGPMLPASPREWRPVFVLFEPRLSLGRQIGQIRVGMLRSEGLVALAAAQVLQT